MLQRDMEAGKKRVKSGAKMEVEENERCERERERYRKTRTNEGRKEIKIREKK